MASLNKLNFYKSSRLDDIKSLFYLIIDFLNDGDLVGPEIITDLVDFDNYSLSEIVEAMKCYRL